MHQVAVLALHDFVPFDLGIACELFGRVGLPSGEPAYDVRVCAHATRIRSRAYDVHVPHGLDTLAHADTVVIPGIEDTTTLVPDRVRTALRDAWDRGARLASICSGAFVLAASGLLDGRRATTHWIGAANLARRYPKILVDPDVLFIDEGRIITSAGASAGIDMCLHLIRKDHGQSVAARAARLAVAPLSRDGGQAQFIRHEAPQSSDSLAPVLEWMTANLHRDMDVELLARRAQTSPRTFARRFREQTGTTPLQWLLTARVRQAQEMLETSRRPIEDIASRCGFDSPVTFRTRFRKLVGLNPTAFRQRFAANSGGKVGPRRAVTATNSSRSPRGPTAVG